MKKLLALLLLTIMLISAVACGGKGNTASTTTGGEAQGTTDGTTSSVDTSEPPVTTEPDYSELSYLERLQLDRDKVKDDLPEKDYDGFTFYISVPQEAVAKSIFSDNESATGVDVATYDREITVGERFGVEFKTLIYGAGNYDSYQAAHEEIFLANDEEFSLIVVWNTAVRNFTMGGYFIDQSKQEYIDFTKPWVMDQATEELSYMGSSFVSVNMLDTTGIINSMTCLYYNKNLYKELNLTENLYDVVREGDWTYDYFNRLVQQVYVDADGSTTISDGDTFGFEFVRYLASCTSFPSFNCKLIYNNNKTGEKQFVTNSLANYGTTVNFMDNFKNFVWTQNVKVVDWETTFFPNNQALFVTGSVDMTSKEYMRDGTIEYGILPYFKIDETQKEYQTSFLPHPVAIPLFCEDYDRSAIIMTALAAEGYKQITGPLYEQAIKVRYVDEDSAEMLDIMLSNVTTDASMMFLPGESIYLWAFSLSDSRNMSSFLASYAETYLTYLQETNDKMTELMNRQEG